MKVKVHLPVVLQDFATRYQDKTTHESWVEAEH